MCESRNRASETMQDLYGVQYGLQSDTLKAKQIQTMQQKYGVDNIQKLPEFSAKARETQAKNWIHKVHEEFPLKRIKPEIQPHFRIDESDMDVFWLKEKASVAFLSKYGFRINAKFGKFHSSFGLVKDGILYQVLRFERKKGEIILADFATRAGYYNPNYYNKVLNVAIQISGIEQFKCEIPRSIATPEVVQSLSLTLISEGHYKVYWITEEGLLPLTWRQNIVEMKQKYDYITSDYLDTYCHY